MTDPRTARSTVHGPGRRSIRCGAAAAAVLAPLLLGAGAAPASAASPLARWEMNEGPGATVMHDVSGHHLDGAIGEDVRTHAVSSGRTGYAFPYVHNGVPPTHPGHLVTVPSRPALNPGTGDYAVTITLKYQPGANGSNVFQKGQAGSPGGYVKLEVHHGVVSCLFRGSAGSAAVGTGVLSDGAWHTVRCARTGGTVTMTADGKVTARRQHATGRIANAAPVSIGGKDSCDQRKVQCDYFPGEIDRVQVDAG